MISGYSFIRTSDLEETFTGTMHISPFYYPANNLGYKMDLTVPLFCLHIVASMQEQHINYTPHMLFYFFALYDTPST